MPKPSAQELGYRPCVGIMVLNPEGLVWIGRRVDTKNKVTVTGPEKWWQMPQGGIDKGEEPAAAAYRELEEETGIRRGQVEIIQQSSDWYRYDLPENLVGKKWGGKYRGQKQKWFAMRFSGRDRDIDINPPPPHEVEFDQWRWAAHTELLDLIVPFKREVYEAVLSDFGGLFKG